MAAAATGSPDDSPGRTLIDLGYIRELGWYLEQVPKHLGCEWGWDLRAGLVHDLIRRMSADITELADVIQNISELLGDSFTRYPVPFWLEISCRTVGATYLIRLWLVLVCPFAGVTSCFYPGVIAP